MTSDAFGSMLLREIDENADRPLATASREKILEIFHDIDTTDLKQLDWDKLVEVVRDGRRGLFGDLKESIIRRRLRSSGIKLPRENDTLPMDTDDRLKASILIVQKEPEYIPLMLDALWDVYQDVQASITSPNNGTSQSGDISEDEREIRDLTDIIINIAAYAVARIPKDAYPTFGVYFFSNTERDIKLLCQESSPLYEVYTDAEEVNDEDIQKFITAVRKNKHEHILIQGLTQKTPFITALLEAINA